jgi:hypothetical protein
MRYPWLPFLYICFSIVVGGISAFYLFFSLPGAADETRVLAADVEKVQTLVAKQASYNEFDTLFRDIASSESGVYAYAVLKHSMLPVGIDAHALGHGIGEIMYPQEGIAGMSLCTHDFGNACSHTMVIGALMEHGTGALPDIQTACHDAPGGAASYVECFHGLGHGMLAFNGYSIERSVDMCEKVGSAQFDHRDSLECFGGALMELMSGGGHDQDIWAAKRAYYLQSDNPFGLCQQDYLSLEYQAMCYKYLTPFAYESFGTNAANPSEEAILGVFRECAKLPTDQTTLRRACFGGQGKEFVETALGRHHTGSITPTSKQLEKMQYWCSLSEFDDGYRYCAESVIASLYSGGEHSYLAPLQYCSMLPAIDRSMCYARITTEVSHAVTDAQSRQHYCSLLPTAELEECLLRLP